MVDSMGEGVSNVTVTFDMRRGEKSAKRPLGRRLDGRRQSRLFANCFHYLWLIRD